MCCMLRILPIRFNNVRVDRKPRVMVGSANHTRGVPFVELRVTTYQFKAFRQ